MTAGRPSTEKDNGADMVRIVRAYHRPMVQLYCWLRFRILHQRFLEEIGQYLPERGRVLDVGCGFGLFSLYFASKNPYLEVIGKDIDAGRIREARRAAGTLSLPNVSYECEDARDLRLADVLDGAYMLDIVHHIPRDRAKSLLVELYRALAPGARLLIKDVETSPAYKRWFTFALDKLMNASATVTYWSQAEALQVLGEIGFQVHRHAMVDVLPYPHILYICSKPQ